MLNNTVFQIKAQQKYSFQMRPDQILSVFKISKSKFFHHYYPHFDLAEEPEQLSCTVIESKLQK